MNLLRELAAVPTRVGALRSAGARALATPADGEPLLSRAARYAASALRALAPYMAPPSPLLKDRSHQWHFERLDLPLAPFKAAAKACKASLNDAFIAGLLGGFARYHAEMGQEVDEIPIGLPINDRSEHASGGGKHFAPGQRAGLLKGATPIERMRHIGAQVARLRDEPALAAPLAPMPLLARLPPGVVAKAMGPKCRQRSADRQRAGHPRNRLPGRRQSHPAVPVRAAARRRRHDHSVARGEHCCIGLNLDARAIAKPDRLMRARFDDVLALVPAASADT